MDGNDRPGGARLAQLFASRRRRVLVAIAALALVVRAVLPSVLRPLIVSQADEALVGHIELADLDLSLLRGGVTLHGFSVHTDERPAAAPALFEADRLWTQISWLALLGRTLEIEELELEGFAVRLDRFADGILLPKPVPASESEEDGAEEAEDDEGAAGWSLAVDDVALRDGRIELRDHTVPGEPEPFLLGVDDFTARELAIRTGPADEAPGRIAVEAKLEQGSVSLSAWIKQYESGIDVRSTLVLDDLPIDKLRDYVTGLDWNALSGKLDATLEHRFASGGIHELSGKASLAALRVGVPRFEEPALAWEDLEVVLERIDLAGQRAEIESVALRGPHLLVDPRAEVPLPLLAKPPAGDPAGQGASAGATSAEPASEAVEPGGDDAQSEPAAETSKPRATDAAAEAETEAASEAEAETPAKPWTWRLRKAEVAGGVVDLRGAESPLPITLEASLANLSSEPASRAAIHLALAETTPDAKGGVALDGELAIDPPAFDGKLAIRALALAPLAAQVEAPALHWLRAGTLRGDLALAFARDLRVSGGLGLAGLDLQDEATKKDFKVAWRDLDVAIASFVLPDPAGRAEPPARRAIEIAIKRLALASPELVLTRGPKGLLLPPLLPGGKAAADSASPAPSPADAEAQATAPAKPGSPPSPESPEATPPESSAPVAIALRIADLRVEGGRARLADRAVEPFYRGRIEDLAIRARGVRWPENEIDALALKMEGLRGARLSLEGAVRPDDSKLEGTLVELPLSQFNPYFAAAGYDLREGALSLESTARFAPQRFETKSRIVVSALDVGGAAGESAFMENFGIPISVALGLLKDLDGRITLAVPVSGERDNVKIGVAGIVRQALQKAIVGALASPLKLLGAVAGAGKAERVAPAPIPFAPGESTPSQSAADRIEDLSGLLAASPGIGLVLTGQTSAEDGRILCERALLDQLEASRGLRALASLGEISTRRAVREHLGRKLAGRDAKPLSTHDAEWLEGQLARAKASDEALAALATARAERLRVVLASEHGVAAARLVVDAPRIDPPAAEPGVAISLANRSARAESP